MSSSFCTGVWPERPPHGGLQRSEQAEDTSERDVDLLEFVRIDPAGEVPEMVAVNDRELTRVC